MNATAILSIIFKIIVWVAKIIVMTYVYTVLARLIIIGTTLLVDKIMLGMKARSTK